MYNPDLLVSCFNTVFCFFIETIVSERLLTAESAGVKPWAVQKQQRPLSHRWPISC